MATLTLDIATLTSSRDATNANAQRILESAFALFHQDEWVLDEFGFPTDVPITYTAQEKLDWIVQVLIPMQLADKARQYEEMIAIHETKEALALDEPTFE